MGTRGWVYIISNKSMPGLAKIGYSSKDPHGRAQELDNTGCPSPYVVEYDVLVESPREVEQQAHAQLAEKREGKEWFRCSLEEAIATVDAVAIQHPAQPSYRASSFAVETVIPPSYPVSNGEIQPSILPSDPPATVELPHPAQPRDIAPAFVARQFVQAKPPAASVAAKLDNFIPIHSGHATISPTPVKFKAGYTPLIPFPRYLRNNPSARWRFRASSFTLEEKAGTRRYEPDCYSFVPSETVAGFAVRDRSILWIRLDDVELSELELLTR